VRASEAARRSGGDDAAERANAGDKATQVFLFVQVDGLKKLVLRDLEHVATSVDEGGDVLHLLERHGARVHLWASVSRQLVCSLAQNVPVL
jgi:hypothetical protein